MANANCNVPCISPTQLRFKKMSHLKSHSIMRKIGILLFLLFSSTIAHSQIETQDFEQLNIEKVMNDIDCIRRALCTPLAEII